MCDTRGWFVCEAGNVQCKGWLYMMQEVNVCNRRG